MYVCGDPLGQAAPVKVSYGPGSQISPSASRPQETLLTANVACAVAKSRNPAARAFGVFCASTGEDSARKARTRTMPFERRSGFINRIARFYWIVRKLEQCRQ